MRKAERKAGNLERSGRSVKRRAENRDSCAMHRVESREAVHTGEPGAFWLNLESAPRLLWFKLPQGIVSFVRLRPIPADDTLHPSWAWDGNEQAPTLKPSVHYVGVWHGWFTAGRMVSC